MHGSMSVVHHGIWRFVGAGSVPFIRRRGDARLFSSAANAQSFVAVHIEEYRTVELCSTAADKKAGSFLYNHPLFLQA